MVRIKTTIELQIDLDEVPIEWKEGLKDFILNLLDGRNVYFGFECRGIVTIKNVEFELIDGI